jgi:hypothetical protein
MTGSFYLLKTSLVQCSENYHKFHTYSYRTYVVAAGSSLFKLLSSLKKIGFVSFACFKRAARERSRLREMSDSASRSSFICVSVPDNNNNNNNKNNNNNNN